MVSYASNGYKHAAIGNIIMKLDIISYNDLLEPNHTTARKDVETALLSKGIVGIRDVPDFVAKSRHYIDAARQFSALESKIKLQYAPNRDTGDTEGYEIGAERFKNTAGVWQVDDKKASFYAFVPDRTRNKWPKESDLKTSYLALGELIFNTGKLLLNAMGLNESVGLQHDLMYGYGRMLHYHKENHLTNTNPDWCGAHLDHGIFTGLLPAYYFHNGQEVDEPAEAGLYITLDENQKFEKIEASDKSILLFQVGEFGQLISNDRIRATRHIVKKAHNEIERFTFALFFNPDPNYIIHSQSKLIADPRYAHYQSPDGSISYATWEKASYEQYRAM